VDGGADTLYGGDGADWIAAGRGADEAFGEAGDDELGGDAGNDTLDGGEGNDLLVGDAQLALLEVALHGNDQLQGGAGNDSLYGNGGADLLLGGEGADLLSGDSSEQETADQRADTLDGGSGNDTLSGAGGADLLSGGDGDDLISADGGADTIDGGAGNDRIWGDSSTLVTLDDGADRVHGGTGEDQLVGGGGDDTLDGGADDDALWGAAGEDELRGGTGDDQLTAGDGHDLLAGHAGDDLMWGEAGNDTLHGGEGLDVVQGEDGNDWLHGGADADTLVGGAGSDVLVAGSGNDEAGGGAGEDSIEGGDGADLVYGDGENDELLGGNGNDRLYGDAGNDTLDGGAGDDVLDGGAGDDTFVLHTFAGNDTLVGGGGTTTLVFAGAAAPPLILAEHTWGSQTVALVLAGTRVELSVAEYRELADLRTDAGAFSGSDIVRTTDGVDRVQLPGTADTLFARGGTDTVHGGDGDDALHGDAGHDQLRGENGADTLAGGDGMDSLYGGAQADTLFGDASLDTLWGEDGDDILDGGSGTDTLWGGDGNDVLAGGAGGDTLDGGAGNDTYRFDLGAETDYLRARTPVTGELDTVLFGAGIRPGSLTLRSYGGNDLHLERAGGDTLIVESFFADLARLPNLQFRFSDDPDTVWSAADVVQRMALPATEGPDARDGFGGNDSLAGLGGADTLFGGAGNDTLSGGDDGDDLEGGEGHDLLQGDAGADTLDGGTGNDQLLGGAGDDALIAGDGSDTLDGGTGADRLEGGSGADTYHYRRGDGNEVVVELDGRTADTAFIDVLRLGPGIAAADVQIAPVLQDFSGYMGSSGFRTTAMATELRIAGSGSIRILEPTDTVNFYSRIDELRFDDAPQSVVSWNQLYGDLTTADEGHDFLQGTTVADVVDARGGDDLVFGSAGADSLAGGSGSDTLFGGSAGDTLDGGAGNDFLRGGDEGSPSGGYGDVLVWGRGYGHDTAWTRPDSQFWVYASSGEPYPADELRLNGVAWSELRALREGDDLALYLEGTADRFTVLGYFASGHQQVRIANGSGGFYLLADVERKIAETAILAQVSTGDDHVVGSETIGESIDALAGNDLVEGRGGNDTLYGGEGNDTLDGGAGSDTLAGGLGNDTYRFGFGGGSDRVLDQDKTTGRIDAVLMDTMVRADDLRIARIADDLVLTLADSGEAITVAKHFTTKGKDVGYHVDAVRFADGSEWNRTTLLDYVNRSAGGHYTLSGSSAADALAGLGGNDTLQGFAGNDTLGGGAGDDRLLGGAGNDVLDGGKGADRYELLPGDGVDLLVDGDASSRVDVLAFGAGIDPATTTAYRDGADLVLHYGAADAVRVRDFYADGTGPGRGVEEIRFANGTLWQRANLQAAGPLPANQPPVARDDASSLVENGTHAMSTTTLLANDADVDGDPLSLTAVRSGFGGTPVLDAASGTVRFTPDLYYTGSAWFAYTLSDGAHTTEGRVNLQVAIDTGTGARLGTEGADTLAGTRGDDRLYGLGGNDVLRADRGNDRLHGGTGNDTLEGAAGNDIYVFHRGDGDELLDNRSARSADVDALYFTAGFARDELWFMREANDLLIGVVGSEDRVLVDEWFGAEASRLDRIHVPGSLIYAAEVEQLVHAMAAFDAPLGTGAVMSSDTRAALEPLLAAAWHPSGP
jgi:Ca2+-binding RTX toxin-like protein